MLVPVRVCSKAAPACSALYRFARNKTDGHLPVRHAALKVIERLLGDVNGPKSGGARAELRARQYSRDLGFPSLHQAKSMPAADRDHGCSACLIS